MQKRELLSESLYERLGIDRYSSCGPLNLSLSKEGNTPFEYDSDEEVLWFKPSRIDTAGEDLTSNAVISFMLEKYPGISWSFPLTYTIYECQEDSLYVSRDFD